MRIDGSLPPILPVGSSASGRVNSFSSSMDSRMHASEVELPALAAASVETNTDGDEPSWLRREECETNQQKRHHSGEDGERSLSGTADDQASEQVSEGDQDSEEVGVGAEENESPIHELDVTL
jgi:hypothetical protein